MRNWAPQQDLERRLCHEPAPWTSRQACDFAHRLATGGGARRKDGIVSTASLIVGVAAADESRSSILIAGVAALFAGAMSIAAGEYVSVSSQADTERADLAREKSELEQQP